MLSPRGFHHADQLRAMLAKDVWPTEGPVEIAYGTLDSLALAVRVVLADVVHLSYLRSDGPWVEARRVATEADLEALWWLAVTRGAGAAQ